MKRGESFEDWIARCDAREARLQSSGHVVYRAFDEFGLLLYIGCTVNLEQRMSRHRSLSKWALFADDITVVEYVGKDAARAAEKAAIDTEGSFFNCTQADVQRTQANRVAATRSLAALGIHRPDCSLDVLADERLCEIHAVEDSAYRELHDELRAALKAGAFPYLTDEDRLDNYLAARLTAQRGVAA